MQRADISRNQLLDALEMRRSVAVAEVVAAVVAPLAAELETRSGRAYLQLLDRPEIATLDVTAGLNRSLDRAAQMLTRSMRHLPRVVAAARRQLCTAFLLRSLADRARAIESNVVGSNLTQPEPARVITETAPPPPVGAAAMVATTVALRCCSGRKVEGTLDSKRALVAASSG